MTACLAPPTFYSAPNRTALSGRSKGLTISFLSSYPEAGFLSLIASFCYTLRRFDEAEGPWTSAEGLVSFTSRYTLPARRGFVQRKAVHMNVTTASSAGSRDGPSVHIKDSRFLGVYNISRWFSVLTGVEARCLAPLIAAWQSLCWLGRDCLYIAFTYARAQSSNCSLS